MRSRLGFLVSSPRLATASKPVYAKKTTAAALSTPTKPKTDGSSPKSACVTGCLMPSSPLPAGSAGGMNGVRLAALTKNSPATTTKTQMATLTSTSRLVIRADSRMPTIATMPRISTMAMAPTLTVLPSSPNQRVGRSSSSAR